MIKESDYSIQDLFNEKDKEKLKSELESGKYNYENSEGQTLLHIASREGNKELIIEFIEFLKSKSLLKEFTNKKDKRGWTPVYHAIDASESGFPEVLELLLRNGANPNSQDIKGISPLHLSSYIGQDDNVEILLKFKADPNLYDSFKSKISYLTY